MAQQQQEQQEEGWPLGLRPLNARVGMLRNQDFNGSISFTTTMLTRSASSTTDSSSDLDTESTGSFFHDKSITLGSLIGFSSILELSRRSIRGRGGGRSASLREQQHRNSNNNKPKPWIFSLCSRITTDAVSTNTTSSNSNHPPSLGHFLEVERRASSNIVNANTNYDNNGSGSPPLLGYGPNDFSPIVERSGAGTVMNSLFVGGEIAAPPQAEDDDGGGRRRRRSSNNDTNSSSSSKLLGHGDGYGSPLMLSCLCGQLIE